MPLKDGKHSKQGTPREHVDTISVATLSIIRNSIILTKVKFILKFHQTV